MNKNDKILIGTIGIICICFLILFTRLEQKGEKVAVVYAQNEKVLTIDLTLHEKKEYQVNGRNGIVRIEVSDGKIRVMEEKSPLHICSKQGYISKSTESIVCLPNQVVIQIETKNQVDTVVR